MCRASYTSSSIHRDLTLVISADFCSVPVYPGSAYSAVAYSAAVCSAVAVYFAAADSHSFCFCRSQKSPRFRK